ncbi:hypothetical protein BLX87_00920 [Bacillus sp. VT-16-64]|nr:hypothetical protein BLX87_00920 [Bacillus sp. VT-16-64]
MKVKYKKWCSVWWCWVTRRGVAFFKKKREKYILENINYSIFIIEYCLIVVCLLYEVSFFCDYEDFVGGISFFIYWLVI